MKTALEALHDLAKDESNRPGAYKWKDLAESCAAELSGARTVRTPDSNAPAAPAAAFPITDDVLDAAIVASYATARPAPTDGSPQERLDKMRANEREQMRAALAAAIEAAARPAPPA